MLTVVVINRFNAVLIPQLIRGLEFFSHSKLFAKEFEVIFLMVNFYFDIGQSSVKSVSHSELSLFLLTEFAVLP